MSTIKKIADIAGVSVATVSYVLNNRPDVSEDTRVKVLEIARRIKYVPSRMPRRRNHLPTKVKSLAFVSCLPFDPAGEWGKQYWGQFLSGCLEEAQRQESILQAAQVDPETTSPANIPVTVRERIADGLIVTGWPNQMLFQILAGQHVPMVLVDTRDVFDGVSHVRPDHGGGSAKAVRYLHDLGHRKIAVITGDMSFACESERLTNYYMAMMQLGLPCKDEWIIRQPIFSEQSGINGIKELAARKLDVTAVICHGDLIARGALTAARELNLRVPQDLSIVGCDNQAWTDKADPPLTTIDVSMIELGQAAVRHLFELMANPRLKPQRITIEAKMVIRQSTGSAQTQ